MVCNYTEIDRSMIESLSWSFESSLVETNAVELSPDNSTVFIKSLNRSLHNDYFFCILHLKSGVSIYATTSVQIIIECKLIEIHYMNKQLVMHKN